MVVFWIFAAVMTVAALAFVLVPLLRSRVPVPRASAEANLEVLRGQRRELDADVAAGTLSPEAREEALADLVARAEADLTADPPAAKTVRKPWITAAATGLLVPAIAVGLYFALGNPGAITLKPTPPATEAGKAPFNDEQIVNMVENLAKKVRERPDDAQGWALLARSMNALNRFKEAAEAYAHLAKLSPGDPNVLADWADALAMAQGRDLSGRPYELVKQALIIDPRHHKALALAGTAALNEGDFSGSIRHWDTLRAQLPPGSEDARRVETIISEIRTRTGATAQKGLPAPPLAAAAPPKPGGSVSGTVSVAPEIAGKIAITDTLFIFARAEGGARVPLAILRASAKELPRSFVLDDSMGMAPGVRLSTTPAVRIEARVSKSGNAMPQPGDLSGSSAVVKPGAKDVKVVIDRVVP